TLKENRKMERTTKTRPSSNDRNNAPSRPVHRITRGDVEAALWERSGRKGHFYQVSFSRRYETEDGRRASSPNFGSGQLPDVLFAAVAAGLWMEAQRQPRAQDEAHEGSEPEGDYDAEAPEVEEF